MYNDATTKRYVVDTINVTSYSTLMFRREAGRFSVHVIVTCVRRGFESSGARIVSILLER